MNVRYLAERTFQAVSSLFVVTTLAFVLMRSMPGGPENYLRTQLKQSGLSESSIDRMVELYLSFHPDEPLLTQYVDYMWSLAHLDLGQSIWFNEPVAQILGRALPWTIFLSSVSLLITFTVGVVVGALMAYREGSLFDVSLTVYSVVLTSIPYYVLAVVLLYVFAYQLGWFPTGGRMDPTTTPGLNWPFIEGVFYHAALPLASMIVPGLVALGMRGNAIRVLGEDYLRVARLRGLSTSRIATRYVARNAILPMYTGLMISLGTLFGGSIILETIFEYPGVGYYTFKAVQARDYPLMMGGFLLITVTVILGIFIADLTYGWVDPRAGTGGEGRESY